MPNFRGEFRRLFRRISQRFRRKTHRQDTISLPTDFEHRIHVILDEETGKYIGLPQQWASIMNTKLSHFARRSHSTPDIRCHYSKQNGVIGNNNTRDSFDLETQQILPKNQHSQESTIGRLKQELRSHREKNTPRISKMNRFSWHEGLSSIPHGNGKIISENMDEKDRNNGVLSPNSLSALLRSESSV